MDESLYKTKLCEHTYLIIWGVRSENLLTAYFLLQNNREISWLLRP